MAAWYAAGTDRLWRYRIPARPGDPKAVLAVYRELGVPPTVLELTRFGLNKTRSPLAIMLPLVWLASHRQASASNSLSVISGVSALKVISGAVTPGVGGVPAYVFDGFSRTGRRALALFLKKCAPLRSFLAKHAPEAKWPKIVAMIIFHIEGGLVDRRLVWPGSDEITREGQIADIAGAGLPIERVDNAMSLVSAHLPALHKARQSVFIPSAISTPQGRLL